MSVKLTNIEGLSLRSTNWKSSLRGCLHDTDQYDFHSSNPIAWHDKYQCEILDWMSCK